MSSPLAHPFNDPSADIILVSSDNAVFKLHKIILSLGSDFFKDMFSLSQPKPLSPSEPQMGDSVVDAEMDGLPVIRVSEPGQVLSKLFRLCYPLDDPPLVTVDEVAAILTAALKYDLRKPIQMASRRLRELMPTASLRVYAIACKLDLEDEARAAAVVIREKKLQGEYVAELEDISIGAYHRLLYYCETGNDPGGLFFTRRPTQRAKKSEEKLTQSKSVSISHPSVSIDLASGSITLPEPSPSAAIAPVVRPPPPTAAGHPFNIANPELTIQASDGIAFRLSKNFIELASPVLFDMARGCSTPSTVQIPEASKVVDIILRICSPVESPSLIDMPGLDSALIAATKYEMKKAIQWLRAALVKKADALSTDPLLLYAVACHHDMRDLALSAAKHSLRRELTSTLHPEVEAIDISAGYLYRLLQYRNRCRDAIRIIFVGDTWIESGWRSRLLGFCRQYSHVRRLPCWYSTYMNTVERESWPGSDSVAKEDILKAALTSSYPHECSYCHRNAGAALLFKFSEYVAATIARLENEVTLDWPSQGPSPTV